MIPKVWKVVRDCRETDDGGLTVSDCFREFFSHTSFVIFPASSSRARAASFFFLMLCFFACCFFFSCRCSLFDLIPIPDLNTTYYGIRTIPQQHSFIIVSHSNKSYYYGCSNITADSSSGGGTVLKWQWETLQKRNNDGSLLLEQL